MPHGTTRFLPLWRQQIAILLRPDQCHAAAQDFQTWSGLRAWDRPRSERAAATAGQGQWCRHQPQTRRLSVGEPGTVCPRTPTYNVAAVSRPASIFAEQCQDAYVGDVMGQLSRPEVDSKEDWA